MNPCPSQMQTVSGKRRRVYGIEVFADFEKRALIELLQRAQIE
jgi:hypothetical protein